ncbi:UNVERIFIED_CONTAM: hypothetical protein Sangu_0828600 [Sesamum angustifolium]|uniref:Uncharacterized protein n=1 Tax=Sesamum angustifolium TaxID=2727405 RepID=A0AAW2PWD9_9LAMI
MSTWFPPEKPRQGDIPGSDYRDSELSRGPLTPGSSTLGDSWLSAGLPRSRRRCIGNICQWECNSANFPRSLSNATITVGLIH